MPKKLDNKDWKNILSEASRELTNVSYKTWFLPLVPIHIDEDNKTLEIAAPESIIASIFSKNKRYVEILESSIELVLHKNYKILIKYMPEDDINKALNSSRRPESAHAVSIDESNPYKEEYYLNPRYNFDNFIIGPNNEYAHAVSLAVSENPSTEYNPLFLYGGSGLGKTHLMHAIGHQIMNLYPSLKVLYVSSEMFTSELVQALQDPVNKNKKLNAFKSKYRSVDVLLIDDIQFIEGKESTQLEFFHTFNTLYGLNKQIVISSDRHPNKLRDLDERLTSRIKSNIMADIQPPDFETRVAILRKKAAEENIKIDDDFLDVIDLIAEKIKFNIRELESAMTRVVSFSKFKNKKINVNFAKDHLTDIFSIKDIDISCESIKKCVCREYGIKMMDMESSKKKREFTYPRQIAMYLCREMTDLSLPKIGESFGGRNHTTVLHACEKISKELKTNPALAEVIKSLKEEIS